MYSPSPFTQSSPLEQANTLSWFPQQVPSQQQQHIEYLLQDQQLPHIPNIHQQQQQQSHILPGQTFNNNQQANTQQTIAPYPAQQPQAPLGQQQQGFQNPSNHTQPSQFWPQQPQKQQQQQFYPQNVSSFDPYPQQTSQTFAWNSFPYGGVKDLVVSPVTTEAPRGLGLVPVVVNPSQLHPPTSRPASQGFSILGSDFDNLESTDEDDEARLQLTKGAYPISTPPLSPHIAEYPGSTAPQGLMQSLAGFSSVNSNSGFLASPTFPSASGSFNVPALQPVIPPTARNKGSQKNQNGATETAVIQDTAGQDADEEDEEGLEEEEEEEDEEEGQEDERQFKCHECPKRFLRQYNLNAHLKTHLLLRAHCCDECPRAFLRPYDLSRHQRIHSKDKPYSCRICNMTFIRNDAIWRHYRKVHPGHPDVPISRRDKMRQKQKKGISTATIGATISSPLSSKDLASRKRRS